jgi:phosphoglycolate phosphatase
VASTPSQLNVFVREGFRWNAQDAYLFDIDGTLLRCRDRIHVNAFLSSVRAVMGRDLSLDGVTLSGNTDPGILQEVFRLSALESPHWEPHFEAILQRMREDVAAHREEMKIDKMPGVDETLRHLRARGAALGIATGNLESIGWLKVEFLGLRHWFSFGGFSDRFPRRADMIAHAAATARAHAGSHASVCVIGDTPADIAAARANQLPTIAVATGNYTFEQLMEHAPDACATNLLALLAAPQQSAPEQE